MCPLKKAKNSVAVFFAESGNTRTKSNAFVTRFVRNAIKRRRRAFVYRRRGGAARAASRRVARRRVASNYPPGYRSSCSLRRQLPRRGITISTRSPSFTYRPPCSGVVREIMIDVPLRPSPSFSLSLSGFPAPLRSISLPLSQLAIDHRDSRLKGVPR